MLTRQLTFFEPIHFKTKLLVEKWLKILNPPIEISAIAGHARYLFVADTRGRIHLVCPSHLDVSKAKTPIDLGILCSHQLFAGKCQILWMKVIDVPNSNGPGIRSMLFAFCALVKHQQSQSAEAATTNRPMVLGYHIYELLPPLNSLWTVAGQPQGSPALSQPLALIKEGFIGQTLHSGPDDPSLFSLIPGAGAKRPPTQMQVEVEIIAKALSKVTCVALAADLTLLTLGSVTGEVILVRGDLASPTGPTRIRRIVPDCGAAVTNVEIVKLEAVTYLFVSTVSSMCCYEMCEGQGHAEPPPPKQLWQDMGFGVSQLTMAWIPSLKSCVAVGPDHAVYIFDPVQGNVSALPVEGSPLRLTSFGSDQIVLLSHCDPTGIAPKNPRFVRNPKPLIDLPLLCAEANVMKVIHLTPNTRFGSLFTQLNDPKTGVMVVDALSNLLVLRSKSLLDVSATDANEGCWYLQYPLPARVHTLARKGCWNWALEVSRKEDHTGELTKLINRLYFLTRTSSNDLTEALNIFEASIRDDQPKSMITFSDFLEGIFGSETGIGSKQVWRSAVSTLLRSLIIYHERGFGTRWHAQLLLECLLLEKAHVEEDGEACDWLITMRKGDFPTELAGEIASTANKQSTPHVVSPMIISALLAIGALDTLISRGEEALAANICICLGDLAAWAQLNPDAASLASGLRIVSVMDPQSGVEYLEAALGKLVAKAPHILLPSLSNILPHDKQRRLDDLLFRLWQQSRMEHYLALKNWTQSSQSDDTDISELNCCRQRSFTLARASDSSLEPLGCPMFVAAENGDESVRRLVRTVHTILKSLTPGEQKERFRASFAAMSESIAVSTCPSRILLFILASRSGSRMTDKVEWRWELSRYLDKVESAVKKASSELFAMVRSSAPDQLEALATTYDEVKRTFAEVITIVTQTAANEVDDPMNQLMGKCLLTEEDKYGLTTRIESFRSNLPKSVITS